MAKGFERVEVTFSKSKDKEMELYKHLEQESEIIGKGKYIKKLINEDMKKAAKK